MKKAIRAASVILSALLVLTAVLPVCAASENIVSPALITIAKNKKLIKSGLKSTDVRFSESDFRQASGLSFVDCVTIISLPSADEGILKLGDVKLSEGDVIPKLKLSYLKFTPASPLVSESSFTFQIGSGGSIPALECLIYIIDTINYAPTVANAGAGKLNVSTKKNVSIYSSITAYDPEGDSLCYEIVSYPSHGTVSLLSEEYGEYKYTPAAEFTGTDSFSYVVRDMYGNYSSLASVSVKVSRQSTQTEFADLVDHWAESAAATMVSAGIMTCTSDGDRLLFNPDGSVTRSEFLTMLMKAAGVKPDAAGDVSMFTDASEIPVSARTYVSTAYRSGFIKGTETENGLFFNQTAAVTRAEAAAMTAAVINAGTPVMAHVFADSEEIPAYAASALCALYDLGILSGSNGKIMPASAVTRAQAAQMLSNLMAIQ